MLVVIGPAKRLDLESPLPTKKRSMPSMLDDATVLVETMATRSPDDLSDLMQISPALADLSFERFQDWEKPFTSANARPALLTFSGDVFVGMDAAATFSERDYTHAQKVLRILSGLYGVLRPLDLIAPYRLEMGTRLENPRGHDLYTFWGHRITDALAADLDASPGPPVLVNLASKEYFDSVQPDRLGARVITPRFLDARGDEEPRTIVYFTKRARGALAAWIIRNRVRSVTGLRDFDAMGYRYDVVRSTTDEPVFIRQR